MTTALATKEEARKLFQAMRAKYRALYDAVKKTHEDILAAGKTTVGHGWDHDLRVAQTGALIAESPRVGEMAWCVGLMHSTDRHYGERTEEVLHGYFALLPKNEFVVGESVMMWNALIEHSKKNSDADNPVTVALKDADRLANLGIMNLFRCGQHHPDIPACIPEYLGRVHPNSTFKKPMSCYDAVHVANMPWEAMLRLPKAKEMGRKEFDFYRKILQRCTDEMEEVGLYPFPSE